MHADTTDQAEATAQILGDDYEIVILESDPHDSTADFAEALLKFGKVAILDDLGVPLILGDSRRRRNRRWVDCETGVGWRSAVGAITGVLWRRG